VRAARRLVAAHLQGCRDEWNRCHASVKGFD
jgi:hypothetical protein